MNQNNRFTENVFEKMPQWRNTYLQATEFAADAFRRREKGNLEILKERSSKNAINPGELTQLPLTESYMD